MLKIEVREVYVRTGPCDRPATPCRRLPGEDLPGPALPGRRLSHARPDAHPATAVAGSRSAAWTVTFSTPPTRPYKTPAARPSANPATRPERDRAVLVSCV